MALKIGQKTSAFDKYIPVGLNFIRYSRILVKRAWASVRCLCFCLWVAPWRLLGHDCLNFGIWGQSFGAAHTQLFLERKWKYGQKRGEARVRTCIFSFLLLTFETQFWLKDHLSDGCISNKWRKCSFTEWVLVALSQEKMNSHAFWRNSPREITVFFPFTKIQ